MTTEQATIVGLMFLTLGRANARRGDTWATDLAAVLLVAVALLKESFV